MRPHSGYHLVSVCVVVPGSPHSTPGGSVREGQEIEVENCRLKSLNLDRWRRLGRSGGFVSSKGGGRGGRGQSGP